MRPIIALQSGNSRPASSRLAASACLAALFAVVFFGSAAHASGIDCNKSTTRTEAAICANAELIKLDRDLATAYRHVIDSNPSAPQLKDAQRDWLATRDAGCRVNKACLIATYEDRIQEFKLWVDINAAADGI